MENSTGCRTIIGEFRSPNWKYIAWILKLDNCAPLNSCPETKSISKLIKPLKENKPYLSWNS